MKVSVLQAMGSSTGVRHERKEVSVEGSSPVSGKFFAEFFLSYNSGIDATMIYLRENSIDYLKC